MNNWSNTAHHFSRNAGSSSIASPRSQQTSTSCTSIRSFPPDDAAAAKVYEVAAGAIRQTSASQETTYLESEAPPEPVCPATAPTEGEAPPEPAPIEPAAAPPIPRKSRQ